MAYQAVFFDLDGTLLDTSSGVLNALDYVERQEQLPRLGRSEKQKFIGPPIQESFERYYRISKEQAWRLAAIWRDVYKDIYLFDALPYEGIRDVLLFCRDNGIKTGVATNKREDYARKLLEHFRFTPLLDCIAGTDFEDSRNKADLIRVCVQKTGIRDAQKCLMVGDTDGDLDAARQAGVPFLGAAWGFGFSRESEDVPVVRRCGELKRYLVEQTDKMPAQEGVNL